MKERPILFSAPMARAILSGHKTQTRRVVKWPAIPQRHDPDYDAHVLVDGWPWLHVHPGDGLNLEKKLACPYGSAGDRLWVKETWRERGSAQREDGRIPKCATGIYGPGDCWFAATDHEWEGPWRPSIFMPRWASRITLAIVDVAAERLNSISEEDAKAEGCAPKIWITSPLSAGAMGARGERGTCKDSYRDLWNDINGAGSWDANPWVWVITFKRIAP